ncbi:type 4b pilus protein PilO2 [Janthinobacterium sp. 17J80-10]|uniref:type 4b pilus protein PilO2 n=1 Tax=Janthinobacterium sp. 17J80-10 TaxID=2497863 RepID=UPI00100567CC|nr:type 4b pilus protein PilO2 [Janthinobacterium sp. 17J80-10]QAU35250.1 hypothetical protein EKL02_14270 [Janthinobacterium sp. 17J80-10]
MQVLKNSSIAIGIEWTLHDSVADARKVATAKGKVLAVRKIIAGECVQGICTAPPKSKKLQAGALLVAAAANDALVYESLGNGLAWVCAIREGIPLHGFDVVVDEDSAKSTLAEVMSYVPAAAIYGNTTGAKCTLDELFAQLNAADKKAATLSAPSSLVTVIALAAILVLLGAAALFVYRHLQQKTSGEASTARQWQSAEEVRRAQEAFNAEVAQARLRFWHARSPTRQFALWYDVLRSLPVSANGWTPSTFTCDLASCQVVWKRDARALPSAAANLPGSASPQAFNPALNESTTSFPLGAFDSVTHSEGMTKIDRYLLDVGVNVNPFRLILDQSQTAVTVTPPAGVEGVTAQTIGQEGVWRATGSNPLLAPGFLHRIELPGVALNAISIKNLNLGRPQYTIELEGRYRVGS